MTYADRYGPAMEIHDPEEANAYLESLIASHMEEWGTPREEAEASERQSLGYFAGYYDHETRQRVERLFGAVHPILGRVEGHDWRPEELFSLGQQFGRAMKGQE
jgi:hypothetical protein